MMYTILQYGDTITIPNLTQLLFLKHYVIFKSKLIPILMCQVMAALMVHFH